MAAKRTRGGTNGWKVESSTTKTDFCSSYGSKTGNVYNKRASRNELHNAEWCECGPEASWSSPPVRIIDTHCHLESLDGCWALPPSQGSWGFGGWWQRSKFDAAATVQHVLNSQPSELSAVISNCCDPLDFDWYEGLMEAWDSGEFRDGRLYWSVGIHPCCAKDFLVRHESEPELEQRMLALAAHPRCIAIGECGLDYCKSSETHEDQKLVFERICRLAVLLKKALVVHARDCPIDAIEILRKLVPTDWPIHVHGYTGVAEDARELLATFSGLCIGFCGAITMTDFHGSCGQCAPLWHPSCKFCGGQPEWVKRDFDALIDVVPLDRILLETDAPYMPPYPFFGRSCQPWMVGEVAKRLASRKGVTVATLIEGCNRNARRVYNTAFE